MSEDLFWMMNDEQLKKAGRKNFEIDSRYALIWHTSDTIILFVTDNRV
jgi:hypothetical protein